MPHVRALAACLLCVACVAPVDVPDGGAGDDTDAGETIADAGERADAGPIHERNSCLSFCSEVFDECAFGECLDACYFNGETPDEGCEPDHYCHRSDICLPRVTRSCAESPCIDTQVCVNGLCVDATNIGCAGEDADNDCNYLYTCDAANGRCIHAPPCATDAHCPVGTLGAVCNLADDARRHDDKIDDVCLFGRCVTNEHCPPALDCEDVGVDGTTLGWCR